MAIKFEKIEPGMWLWEKRRQRDGFGLRRDAWFQVQVISIDPENKTAMAKWNHNPPAKWFRRSLEKLYRNKPIPKGAK